MVTPNNYGYLAIAKELGRVFAMLHKDEDYERMSEIEGRLLDGLSIPYRDIQLLNCEYYKWVVS